MFLASWSMYAYSLGFLHSLLWLDCSTCSVSQHATFADIPGNAEAVQSLATWQHTCRNVCAPVLVCKVVTNSPYRLYPVCMSIVKNSKTRYYRRYRRISKSDRDHLRICQSIEHHRYSFVQLFCRVYCPDKCFKSTCGTVCV